MADAMAIVWGRRPRRPPSPADILRAARDGGHGTALVERGRTAGVRLNSDDGRRYPPERLSEVPDNAAKLKALKEEIARDIDLFARHQRAFLDLYFAFIDAQVADHSAALESRLAWSGGLFTAADYAFSAWRPLPNTAIALLTDGQAKQGVLTCDVAFWTGAHLIALSVKAVPPMRGVLPPLSEACLVQAALPTSDIAKGRDLFADTPVPPEFLTFWETEAVPSSPFRPEGLRESSHLARQD